ncbi:MAG TPA: hypothetical protein VG929_03085 [Actinomycetota bacterium]|nr:hypothetical protein [Actinomycetota bacterium]
MKKAVVLMALTLAISLVAGVAHAEFTPKFSVKLDNTKVNGNPAMNFYLEFDEEDDEIGLFTGFIPKGFTIATDEQIPNNEKIGSGVIQIRGGLDCRPGPEGQIPLGANATVPATFYEKAVTDDEADSGVIAVWLLDLEPLNRVRLLVKGSPTTGYSISGAPTPSDNTCNPLTADLTINAKSQSGVPIMTNPATAGKKVFKAEITSQDSPEIAKFKQAITITK